MADRVGAGARALPLAWFALAHLCLLVAFGAVALAPAAVAGFYYHPKLLAVVHLVTLGWITASILGALYMVLPMAFGCRLPAGRADRWVLAGFALGATGMASHFWIDEVSGMVWSAGLAALTALWVAGRAALALERSSVPPEIRLHFHLAFVNLLLAAGLGVAIGVDKLWSVMPGASLDHVLAHAHLAALGWGVMTVMAAGYRLLPMLLPAAPPRGGWVVAGAVLLEVGVLGLAACLFVDAGPRAAFAACVVAALAVWLSRVGWMLAHRRPSPPALPRPDLPRLQLAGAVCWLLVAAGLGLALAAAPAASWKLGAAMAYGVAGLVGFLSQMVVGVAARFVPLWVWLGAYGGRLHDRRPPSPYRLADRRLQVGVLALWTAGVPALALGLSLDRLGVLRLGGALLAAAAAAGFWQLLALWRLLPRRG